MTACASLLWGTVFVAADIGLRYTDAFVLVFLRFGLASIVISVLALVFHGRLGIAHELKKGSIWFLGFVDTVGFLLQYAGQSLTNASDATLLANLAPVLVPLVAWRISSERISRVQTIAMILGLSGLFLIAIPSRGSFGGSVVGDLCLFGASASFALFVVFSKRFRAVTAGSALAVILTIAVFVAPAALTLGKVNMIFLHLNPACLCASVYMGVVCTVIPMVLYLRGLRSISTSESGTLLLLEVLSGLILAVSFLGQIPTGYQMLAGSAIVAALTLGVAIR